jgi:hypothetical protein
LRAVLVGAAVARLASAGAPAISVAAVSAAADTATPTLKP